MNSRLLPVVLVLLAAASPARAIKLQIGDDNVLFPYSTVGVASQDLKYRGERAFTYIGNRNRIREFVSIHRGTEGGGLNTRIGDDNSLLAYCHIAHDVQLGNHCVLSNGVTFAGHVTIGDWAVISAHSAVHQFCRIGRHSMIGGFSVVVQDVLPFSLTTGQGREIKLFDVNKNYDFVSVRAGIQPFVSDFRGFIFSDNNLGLLVARAAVVVVGVKRTVCSKASC